MWVNYLVLVIFSKQNQCVHACLTWMYRDMTVGHACAKLRLLKVLAEFALLRHLFSPWICQISILLSTNHQVISILKYWLQDQMYQVFFNTNIYQSMFLTFLLFHHTLSSKTHFVAFWKWYLNFGMFLIQRYYFDGTHVIISTIITHLPQLRYPIPVLHSPNVSVL